jgi:acetolactate synthase-1/2/3 large subunit
MADELETPGPLRLPITVAAPNNGILGYQKHAGDVLFDDHTDGVDFSAVDHAAIDRACGVQGVRIERREDVAAALDAAFAWVG